MIRNIKIVFALFGILLASSTAASAVDYTIEDLHKSSQVATESFKSKYGEELHDSLYYLHISKGRKTVLVRLFYRQNDEAQSVEYYCHYHEVDVLDCHED